MSKNLAEISFVNKNNCSVTSVKNDNTPAVSIFTKHLSDPVEVGINFNGIYPADCDFYLSLFYIKASFFRFFIGFLNLFINFSVWELVILSLPHPNFMFSSSYLQQKTVPSDFGDGKKAIRNAFLTCFFIDGREFSAENGARFQLQTVKYRRFACRRECLIVFSSFEIAPLAFIALLRNGLCGECPSPKYILCENSALS